MNPAPVKIDISRITNNVPTSLIGREPELYVLADAWKRAARGEGKRPRVLTFVAMGGEGKTSLVARWVTDLASEGWGECELAFAWSFYREGTGEQVASSSDYFLREALRFFGDPELAASPRGAYEKAKRLAELVGGRRAILVLDGIEPLQYPPNSKGFPPGKLRDEGVAVLLKKLAESGLGLCVVTTRYSVHDLTGFRGSSAPEHALPRLPRVAGVALLRQLGVRGSLRPNCALPGTNEKVNEFELLVEDVKGHALTLNLLGTYLRTQGGDIRKRALVKLADADAASTNEHHAARVMDAYVRWYMPTGLRAWVRRQFSLDERKTRAEGKQALAVLRVLGLFDRPADAGCLNALWSAPAISGLTDPLIGLTDDKRIVLLRSLEVAKLLTVFWDGAHRLVGVDTHPHIRDYFARSLAKEPEAWKGGHRRLFEYLCANTKEVPLPTVEQLQPLYQAVAHGCHAGLHQEVCDTVYRDRLMRRENHYASKNLGAVGSNLGAVACFFETLWERITPALEEDDQAYLLHEAAIHLRGSGQLSEAVKLAKEARARRVSAKKWKEAAISTGNLSELELLLGDVASAVQHAKESVAFVDDSGDAFQMMARRTICADILHQAGLRDEAWGYLVEVERMQETHQAKAPLRYPVHGFTYCDVLLVAPERRAWNVYSTGASEREDGSAIRKNLDAVRERAARRLAVAMDNKWLLGIGFDHLTLGRAALFEAILCEESSAFLVARENLDRAVAGLRSSGSQDHLPVGLLSRAWLRACFESSLTGPDSAQEDLDEAWEIAERGPMKLFMADILLYRARLFGHRAPYPWGSARADLAEARTLIERCGYARRTEELADAELASINWPNHTRPLNDKERPVTVTTKTLVELDLVGYSTIAAEYEHGLGVKTSLMLKEQIRGFIDAGLKAAGVTRAGVLLQDTGDGAILMFDHPEQAHTFADAVHHVTRTHNANIPVGTGKRVFRVGISTGELVTEPREGGEVDIGGLAISRAVRLEGKANPGEVLCDTATYNGLTSEQQARYSGVEIVAGKRDEKFEAHRAALYPGGMKDADFFTGSPTKSPTQAAPPKAVPAAQGDKANRKEILSLFKELKAHQFVELLFLLDVPIKLRPARVLNFEEQKNELLTWAAEAKELDTLLSDLRGLVGGDKNPQ